MALFSRSANPDQVLTELGLGERFTFDELIARLQEKRGRPLVFLPAQFPSEIYGAWISTEVADYVLFEENTSPIHQVAIKLHEIAHILCGLKPFHVEGNVDVGALFRSLPAEEICQLVRREHYARREEQQMEELATRLMERLIWDPDDELFKTDKDLDQHVKRYTSRLDIR